MNDEIVTWTVSYSIGTYSGDVSVRASADAEREHVIALAKQRLRRMSGGAALPFGAESFRLRVEEPSA